ncbi:MAG: AAA family ATPase [Pirellulales bacterium]|nr:AAA family ATPase [Pirellulales bacterium]
MLNSDIISVLQDAGFDLNEEVPNVEELREIDEILQRSKNDPRALAVEWLRARRHEKKAKRSCVQATQSAEKLEKLLKDLVEGNALLYRLEAVHAAESGSRAICRSGNQMREFSVHPSLDCASLERIQPWEYVRVCENVVVGTWADDPSLFADAHGQIVAFKGYHDRDLGLVHVSENAHGERVVRLADNLREQEIPHGSKLVLQRDHSGRAIAVVPGLETHSRFEIPIEQINTRLDELACIEPIARQLIEEVMVHVLNPDVCSDLGLEPMRGFLLSSYKPGMGKTAFVRGFAYWLHEFGQQHGFDVVLYFVPPNATKNLFHGEDARIVREDLWGAIRARQSQPRERGLFQFVVFDEVDSLGKRTDANHAITSSAQSDALEALLSEMDGLVQTRSTDGPPAYVLVGGMTNLPERVDEALKRPGRLGDLDLEMPEIDLGGAEDILAIYARGGNVPWYVEDTIRRDLDDQAIRAHILRPALTNIFSTTVLQYSTDTQRRIDVTAGQILAGVHFKEAMILAKKLAAIRIVRGIGLPAVSVEDLEKGLSEVALSTAHQMEADKNMLIRQLRIKVPVASVDTVPRAELDNFHYMHIQTT